MIVTIIIWIYLAFLFYAYGFAVFKGLLRIFRLDPIESLSFPITALVGMATVSIIVSLLNLFLPLGVISSVILFIGGVALFVLVRPPLKAIFPERLSSWFLLLFLIIATLLELATHRPSSSDTALYHAQTIRWFESFPVTPGLGNLNHRLAFNSSWLVLNAAFSFAFLDIRSFHLMGAFLFLICMVYFFEAVPHLTRSRITDSAVIKLLFIPLGFHLFASVISSPAYDMPVSLLVFVIVVLWVENHEEGFGLNIRLIEVFLLSLYAITIKLSAIPMAGFAVWVFLGQIKRDAGRRALILICLAMLFIIPWVIRSVVLSGYLVFPLSQIDLFSFDWKVPQEQAQAAGNGIIGFARLPGKDWESSLAMSYSEWVPMWVENLTVNQKSIALIAAFSPLLLLLNRLSRRSTLGNQYGFGYLVLVAGVLFWFLTAPDIRFGYGFLAGLCIYAFAPLLAAWLRKFDPALSFTAFSILFGLLIFQGYTFLHSLDLTTLEERLVLPADYSRSRAESCDIKNGKIYCRVEGGQCNYDAFPCIPSPRPNVEMRGATFRDGFRVAPSENSQREPPVQKIEVLPI